MAQHIIGVIKSHLMKAIAPGLSTIEQQKHSRDTNNIVGILKKPEMKKSSTTQHVGI